MTYIVSSDALNSTHSLTQLLCTLCADRTTKLIKTDVLGVMESLNKPARPRWEWLDDVKMVYRTYIYSRQVSSLEQRMAENWGQQLCEQQRTWTTIVKRMPHPGA